MAQASAPQEATSPASAGAPAVPAPAATSQPPAPEPAAPDLAAEVMKRRGADQLRELVREKKQLEAKAEKYKAAESKVAAYERIERLMDAGDDDEAVMELLKLKHGEKAAERLAPTYNGLTRRVLGTQANPELAKVEQRVSRFDQRVEKLEQEKAQAEAKLAEMESKDRESRIQGAIKSVGDYLKTQESAYPHLLAEADAPEDVVWNILEEAEKHGQELTLEQAAKLADDHFKPAFERKAARYQNLLAPKTGNVVPTKPEASPSTKAAPPRKSLTNADASQAATEETPLPPPRNEQERRDRSFAVLQKSLNKT